MHTCPKCMAQMKPHATINKWMRCPTCNWHEERIIPTYEENTTESIRGKRNSLVNQGYEYDVRTNSWVYRRNWNP